jgi:hypothetical protein
LVRNVTAADSSFAQELLQAANELESALVTLSSAYSKYETFKKSAQMTDEQYQEFLEISEGIEFQFKQFTVKADEIELKTCAEQMVQLVGQIRG